MKGCEKSTVMCHTWNPVASKWPQMFPGKKQNPERQAGSCSSCCVLVEGSSSIFKGMSRSGQRCWLQSDTSAHRTLYHAGHFAGGDSELLTSFTEEEGKLIDQTLSPKSSHLRGHAGAHTQGPLLPCISLLINHRTWGAPTQNLNYRS